jgi:Fe-S-cluster containining protein
VPPNPPPKIRYPDHWYSFLAGEAVENQQLCPFLFQYFGEPLYFCAIHHIKPLACRRFGRENCRKRLADRNLHA